MTRSPNHRRHTAATAISRARPRAIASLVKVIVIGERMRQVRTVAVIWEASLAKFDGPRLHSDGIFWLMIGTRQLGRAQAQKEPGMMGYDQAECNLRAEVERRLQILMNSVDPLANAPFRAEQWPSPRILNSGQWFSGAAERQIGRARVGIPGDVSISPTQLPPVWRCGCRLTAAMTRQPLVHLHRQYQNTR